MQTVDKTVRFVEVFPQLVHVAAIVCGATNRCTTVTALGRFELLGNSCDMLVQCCEQLSGLGNPHVVDHLGILSRTLNVRSPTLNVRLGSEQVN